MSETSTVNVIQDASVTSINMSSLLKVIYINNENTWDRRLPTEVLDFVD